MRLATNELMREVDRITIEEVGIPGAVLMENAGRAIANAIEREFGGRLASRSVLVVSGRGNNGGDGSVIARVLLDLGWRVRCLLLSKLEELKGDAALHFGVLSRLYPEAVLEAPDQEALERALKANEASHAALVVDAILGTGIQRPVEGLTKAAIVSVNALGKQVVSVDIASGVNGSTGKVMGEAVRAKKTYPIGLMKLGQALYPGADYQGELEVIDIGFSETTYAKLIFLYFLGCEQAFMGALPKRSAESHKGTYGHVLVLAGSRGKTGAAVMAATAAARVGAGLVTLAIPASEYSQASARLLEVMQAPLEANALGEFAATQANFGALEALLDGKQAVVFGPGVGVSEDTRKLAAFLFLHAQVPVVVDADGLNLIAQDPALLIEGKRPPVLVLTPHPGEMARLTGQSTKAVQNDRAGTAKAYAGRHGVFLVLKGAKTITACPEGPVWVNASGCPAMASGGMGDVLSGMLGGLLAQGLSPYTAIPFGVFVHGAAGERMAAIKGTYGLLAGDLLGSLPSILGDYVAQNPSRPWPQPF